MIAMELVNGRPADCAGRLEKEIRCYDLLDSLGIDYRRIDHEAAMTMEACEEIDRVLDAVICKNLLLCNRQCTDFYLLMLPGDKHFKTSVLSKEIGSSRLSFAAPEYMDEDVLKGEYIGCHPCINTSSLRFRTADLMEKILPTVHHEALIVTLPQE